MNACIYQLHHSLIQIMFLFHLFHCWALLQSVHLISTLLCFSRSGESLFEWIINCALFLIEVNLSFMHYFNKSPTKKVGSIVFYKAAYRQSQGLTSMHFV